MKFLILVGILVGFAQAAISGGSSGTGITLYNVDSSTCLRQSQLDKDYCGPEDDTLISWGVADELWGPFRGSCESHDFCYYSGAAQVVDEMETKYRMSLAFADDAMKAEFQSLTSILRQQCDDKFLNDLLKSCEQEDIVDKTIDAVLPALPTCKEVSYLYYGFVSIAAKSAFLGAIDNVLSCPRLALPKNPGTNRSRRDDSDSDSDGSSGGDGGNSGPGNSGENRGGDDESPDGGGGGGGRG